MPSCMITVQIECTCRGQGFARHEKNYTVKKLHSINLLFSGMFYIRLIMLAPKKSLRYINNKFTRILKIGALLLMMRKIWLSSKFCKKC
jgi:hypothetical protein